MKNGWILPHLACCGGVRRILEISNRLTERGHEQVIFLPEKILAQEIACDWFPVKAKLLSLDAIRETELDTIEFCLESQWELALESPAPVKVNYILHYSALYKDVNEARDSYAAGYKKLANSNWTADMIFLETGSRPRVVHGGINPDHFRSVDVPDVPKEYDVLCYGSSRYWKGTKTIEEAVGILGLRLEKYDGKGIPQEKMAEEYGKARIFVSGSYFEGWNQCGLEAMACGTPLIITKDGGSEDYVVPSWNALVIPPREPKLMAEVIELLLEKEGLQKYLTENGLKTAEKFRWEKTTDRIEEIFQEWLK